MAGATVVNQIPSDGDFFDLFPEMIDRESFIDIIKPKKYRRVVDSR